MANVFFIAYPLSCPLCFPPALQWRKQFTQTYLPPVVQLRADFNVAFLHASNWKSNSIICLDWPVNNWPGSILSKHIASPAILQKL